MTRWMIAFPLLFACHKASVGLPPTFDGQRYPVTGLHKPFSKTFTIGDTAVNDVHRGWTHGHSAGFGPVEAERERKKWSFQAGADWRGDCGVNTSETELSGNGPLGGATTMTVASSAVIGCTLAPAAGPSWTLNVTDASGRPEGWISGGDRQVRLAMTSEVEGSSLHMGGLTGWVALEDNHPVMVVDVMNDGAVWFARDLPTEQRAPLMAAAAALLLYDDPRQS